ncbi:MAG: UDP-N-acetylmuramoyl-L-alanyl-D-glutamate--2,6-diaminopimelate ligase, partial [Planctomycetes bacterium]|nr:UDP-N-acetylmuramoyl-L-alanyl-D-glutamate--2,6-diaminopimelate ligase [Planctomycetota bacterium]
MKTSRLFADQAIAAPLPAELDGVCRDSRRARPGVAFIAQAEAGEREAHMAQAAANGATAVLAEPAIPHARWA